MKKTISLLAMLASLATAGAQGSLQLEAALKGSNETPPNSSLRVGTGQLTLTGNSLDIFVGLTPTFPVTGAFIQGPAGPGSTGPVIFDLGTPLERPPIWPIDPGGYEFVLNGVTLSSGEISDLLGGLWYVNVTSGAFPDGEIRGQILAVPEPTTFALLALGAGTGWLWLRRRS